MLPCAFGARGRKKKERWKTRSKLTEKSNSKAFQDASPPPQEEITPAVCQETYYSTGEGDQKVGDGQIDNDVVERLSELFVLVSDVHDEEILEQRQRGDHEHEHRQHSEVPLRDVRHGSAERIDCGGQHGRLSVGHRVHCQAKGIHRPCHVQVRATCLVTAH